ncbi:amino acid adenylation domain-containing protein [Lysobacter sp. F60174L2]|uniref:amino acid adenylation domain-containing protein n=1 Tax=Lysobacter sp. F60174L2 TaxID=3459295 RepID=UPI00403D6CBB
MDAATTASLHALARRHGTDPGTVVLAGWCVLLMRLSARDQMVIEVAGEAPTELRVDLSHMPGTGELLAALHELLVSARDLPVIGSVEATTPGFGYHWHSGDSDNAPGEVGDGYELALSLGCQGDGITGSIQYDPALHRAQAAESYPDYLRNLLQAMVADEACPIDRLPLLDDRQRLQALREHDAPAADYPLDLCVHELFEAQVQRSPDAVAVVDAHAQLDYAQLNTRANRLAHHLRAIGIKPDDRVAIFLERGTELIVALLAVLKAGAAYVPLDPTYPLERLGYTLEDSEPAAVLTTQDMVDGIGKRLAIPAGVPVLDLADATPPWHAQSPDNPETADAGLLPRHLAYVLYTSGSTGKPKGVAMPHAPLVNLVQWQLRQPGAAGPLRTLQFAALGFDVAFQETFATLCAGGQLFLVDADTRVSATRLFQFIREHRIERAFLPYFALQMLAEGLDAQIDALAPGEPLDCALREVITAGEQLRIEPRIRRFFQRVPGCRLHNHYGPTESHVVTALTLPGDPADWPRLPAIGAPISNARVYVLDTHGEPVPSGVVGELYLAGPVLACGYLKRPDLDAGRFLDDPFSEADGARMYRTGDLGRWLPDGTLECLGRQDFQVKVRGFRIELGEIEAQVMACPGVREAGVVVREDSPGFKRIVAYYSPLAADAPVDVDLLRRHLAAQLPDYMVPVAYVALDALPLTPNGKLDRAALPAPGRQRPDWAGPFEPAQGELEVALCRAMADVLDLEKIGRNDNFFELGGGSLLAVRVVEQVKREAGLDVAITSLFAHPSPAALAMAHASAQAPGIAAGRMGAGRRAAGLAEPIAIIAMAGRFPGANDVEAFWDNLCEGRDSISHFSLDEIDRSVPEAVRRDPAYVPARGLVDGVELFDAAFFGISPREAELMDPQQRIFLELCWECMERGGHVPGAGAGPVGVFAGMYNASYYQHNVLPNPELVEKVGAFTVMLDNEKDYIATRVAHKLDLTGPAVSVHTGCSTSLVAICQAVDNLRLGRCDMALAGGVAVTSPLRSGHLYQEGAMLSSDGHTRSFDAAARGTVFSDGGAVLLLKRLSDAQADGDTIHAVIRGAAINNDGGDKASFTAPSSEGQAAVIAMAHDDAGIDPRSISYVETHGTATPLGDPIEIEGLTRAFRRGTDDNGFCRVGSVKSNIGHLVSAAGVAGTIKAALALSRERIPATVHFTEPNPAIDFAATPFTVNARLHDWPRQSGQPRRAGVSSFGVGGTNAHLVLEEAPLPAASETCEGPHLLVLSARKPAALAAAAARLAEHLEADPGARLDDVAWTLAAGRKAFPHRLSLVADDVADAIASLRDPKVAAAAERSRPAHRADVVFMFPGQGATYPGMGRELYRTEPAFRRAFDECIDNLPQDDDRDLRALILHGDADALRPTAVMQPATFIVEYALARMWMDHGLQPAALVGHSVGEFVAAALAGVFTLADALRLVVRRGALMQAQPGGAMLSVRIALDALQARLPDTLSLAAENAPGACVVAGPHEDIAAFQASLEADGIACRALCTSHAFHSSMMDPVVAPFRAEVEAMVRTAPVLPVVSTATGQWLDAETACSPDYWAGHLRQPVRFAKAIECLVVDTPRVLLEVGPRTTLGTLARQHPAIKGQPGTAVLSSLSDHPDAEQGSVRQALGQAWCRGVPVDPACFDRRARRCRVRLPTYPFDRQRYWVEAPSTTAKVVLHPAIAAAATPESQMPHPVPSPAVETVADRKPRLMGEVRDLFEDIVGFDLSDADTDANFMELGLDSLMLTQVALQLQKAFPVAVTFRQLMGDCSSLDRLVAMLDTQMPAEAAPAPAANAVVAPVAAPAAAAVPATDAVATAASVPFALPAAPAMASAVDPGDFGRMLISQQMQLMSQQLALLAAGPVAPVVAAPVVTTPVAAPVAMPAVANPAPSPTPAPASQTAVAPVPAADDEVAQLAHTRYDVQKAFGAIARIHTSKLNLDERQHQHVQSFMQRYIERTGKSKAYTREHRPHMADPRVVNGFRPAVKEIVYQIVVERSKGAHVFDIDGNEYVDATNGFGTSMFGWQPGFVMDAIRAQLDLGYEIGPQHPLAGEVTRLVCELTGHDRAALCNTGSEAVMGAIRVARTITGRNTVVMFSGSYHGINDEVIVRGTRKLKSVPAAPGILPNTAENVLVLDYGTDEALEIIRARAGELAAVLVEPVQSRRPDFQPAEFLREVRRITEQAGAALIFDEVITGFRSHPGGAQALFGIKADLATYGKVIGGGYPIGVIAGKRAFMDALDGGHWDYGDDSQPTVGVTYFAGTFVRHPLALAAAHAVLVHMKESGPALQQGLNARVEAFADELNAFCLQVGAPLRITQFASLWRTQFLEDHPMQEMLFAMMRIRGIHILDNFPCFFTTAHSEADFQAILKAYKDAVLELQGAGLLPRAEVPAMAVMDASQPPVPGARLGREPDGRPAWFVPNDGEPGKFLKVGA